MDISVLFEFANVVAVGICLCVGYVIKNLVPSKAINKYIPLILDLVGVLVIVWANHKLTPELLLSGLISGLIAVALYETFRNIIESGLGDTVKKLVKKG